VLRFIDGNFEFRSTSGSNKSSSSSYYGRVRSSIKLLTRQRLLSLNVGSRSTLSSGKTGYSNPVFKQCLSRGYAGVSPIIRSDHGQLSDFGPFYSDSENVQFIGHLPFSYWQGRNILFPFAEVNCVA